MHMWQQVKALVAVKIRQSLVSAKIAPMVYMGTLMAIFIRFVLPGGSNVMEQQAVMLVSMLAFVSCVSPTSVAMYHLTDDKEQGTLRLLLDSQVSPRRYLGAVLITTNLLMLGALVISWPFLGIDLSLFGAWWVLFLHIEAAILISSLWGLVIGLAYDKSATASAASVLPMLAMCFIPLYSSFNPTLAQISPFVYTGRVIELLLQRELQGWGLDLLVYGGWFLAAMGALVAVYRRRSMQLYR